MAPLKPLLDGDSGHSAAGGGDRPAGARADGTIRLLTTVYGSGSALITELLDTTGLSVSDLLATLKEARELGMITVSQEDSDPKVELTATGTSLARKAVAERS